jgi:DNA-directed RNA polymerase subunit M/transcription elongation factor TFIIS
MASATRKYYCVNEKNILCQALEEHPSSILLSDEEFDFLLVTIERSCNNAAAREAEANYIPSFWNYEAFRRIYTSICYRVNTNLDPTSSVANPYFGRALINFMFKRRFESMPAKTIMSMTGIRMPVYIKLLNIFRTLDVVDPANAGFMSSEELYPGRTKDIRDEIELRRNQKIKYKTSSRYECHECHKRKTRIEERQTRSFDEAATTFITCVNCGHQWTKG